ncbi:MAG: RNA methyltransferase [Aphanocapsa sp. GSE-SYN-MK-11-07L]|jgi:TrmH family RNA methyltransferase|nr:RNA methyltransferase [Aphanocapsa sp. GSE-SYN-MK-11-07L]
MLTSLQNPLVKHLRKLQQPKYRRSQQQFLLEGTHLLLEACAVGWPLDLVCFTPDWQAKQSADLLAQLDQTRIEVVSESVLQAIATTITPDGVVAVAQACPSPELTFGSLGLVLENIQDPGNLGTMIRTAAAAGAEGILVSADCVDLENPKVLRASAGQWFRLPIATVDRLHEHLTPYRSPDWQIVATLPQAKANYWDLDLTQPTLFLLGNEGAGLSDQLIELSTHQVKIPLQQGVESLNVAIAAALMLYECQRQRQLAIPIAH